MGKKSQIYLNTEVIKQTLKQLWTVHKYRWQTEFHEKRDL